MKKFTRIEPTTNVDAGLRYKRQLVIKNFKTDDGLVHEFTTFYKEGSRGGAIIAITPDNQIVTTYQFRSGPECWMYELPGGGFHEGEDPQQAAIRELREETGYVPGSIEFLGESSRDSYSNCIWHYYLATDCIKASATELDKEEDEQGVEIRLISITQLIEDAKKNKMSDPHAVLMAYDKLKVLEKETK